MKLVYSGAHAEVEVPDTGITAKRDEPVDVPDAVAKRLLEQGTWSEAKAAPKSNRKDR